MYSSSHILYKIVYFASSQNNSYRTPNFFFRSLFLNRAKRNVNTLRSTMKRLKLTIFRVHKNFFSHLNLKWDVKIQHFPYLIILERSRYDNKNDTCDTHNHNSTDYVTYYLFTAISFLI